MRRDADRRHANTAYLPLPYILASPDPKPSSIPGCLLNRTEFIFHQPQYALFL